MHRIGIVGCAGRMGQMLLREVLAAKDCELAGATERPGSDAVGRDVAGLLGGPETGVVVSDDPQRLFQSADAVIDFTAPEATVRHAALAADARCAHVIGTTGLTAEQEKRLQDAAARTAIVFAANMSLGVNLLLDLVERVAKALDPAWDIEIVEMHHRHKVDAPSGTALALGKAAARGRQVELDAVAQRVRDGHTGPRKAGDIGFATLRGGDVVGEHTVIFAGEGERIELTHKAGSRTIFARGAVQAARWAHGKPPGLYSMFDVLGLG